LTRFAVLPENSKVLLPKLQTPSHSGFVHIVEVNREFGYREYPQTSEIVHQLKVNLVRSQ
jgi:hypothetical protein